MTPERIKSEIQRLAKENGDKPLGERLFVAATGLQRSQLWAAGYASYSDALAAAGYARNRLNAASDRDTVLDALVALMRKIGRFPTKGHIKAARATDGSVPSYEAFLTVAGGLFSNLPNVARVYCQQVGASDVAAMLPLAPAVEVEVSSKSSPAVSGYVYLVKHEGHYKIGRSNDVTRRRREVSLLLPKELEHVHIIETDDPEGIEAYWHRRFAAGRLRGEWFTLTTQEVAAFKRRRYQ